jgi:hypothetical protein
LTNTTEITITLPSETSGSFHYDFIRLGAGAVTFAAPAGMTLFGTPGLNMRAQYSSVTAMTVTENGFNFFWVVIGDLS